ncbi:MAG: CARDB domain-containing protein, partial [Thermodesulfovibrionales bacterium]
MKRLVHNLAQTFIAVMLSAVPVSPAVGAIDQFAAKTIGDHGNVTVMEVMGNYDEKNPDGTVNAGPRQIISKEFYRLHKDEYDFLVIFSNFNFRLSDGTIAFYLGARNDTQGIGNELFDNSPLFGSSRLQGTIDMGNIANLSMVPTDPKFQFTLDTISHEMMHRWAAYARFRNPDGSLNTGLLGKDSSHWSFLLSTDASLMYGNTWQDNGNGTFTSVRARKYYSPLDLYLMGFIDKSQVPPMLLIENPDIDPKRVSQVGVTMSGTPRYITIDDIIAAEGERVPGPADAQRTFKTAFIFITEPGTFTGDEIYGLDNVRNGWLTRYSVLTDGAGLVQVALSPIDNLPVKPGVIPPTVTPRTLPPNIDDALAWMLNDQKTDGSWMDLGQTAERDTAEAVVALKEFVAAGPSYSAGLQWLGGQSSGSTDYLVRTTEALADAGLDTASQMSEISSRQNSDGGWGSGKSFASSPSDTGLVLKMLAQTGYTGQPVIAKAIEYLKARQNLDGGWGIEEGSRVETTANVLFAFRKYAATYAVNDRIDSGSSWLLQHQNPDGGFGNSPSTVYDTARALLTLAELDIAKDGRNKAIGYIQQNQSGDGSWHESPYQTALAIEALYKVTVDPDLAVKASDLSFSPATITALPSTVILSANISNLGRTAVPQAKVALYENIAGSMAKLAEQTISFPGTSTVTVYFPILFDDESSRTFYITADPENLVPESDKANNTASRNLQAGAGIMPDLAITPLSISFVPQTIAAIPSTLAINVDVANLGSSTVPQAKIALYDGDVSEANKIAEQIAAFPGRGNTTVSFPVAITDGRERVFTVAVDPANLIKEADKTNNMAVQRIKPVAFVEPDLSISSNDITFAPSTIGTIPSTVTINARIANFGKTAAQNFKVALYEGVISDAGRIGETTASVQGEDFVALSFSTTVNDASDHKYIVSVDPDNQVPESIETNNTAWNVLKNSLVYDFEVLPSDLSASPNPVDLGQDVTISSKISNKGRQNAYSVHVRYYIDLPGAPLEIATTTVDIPAGGSVSNQVIWKTSRPGSDLPVTVYVDPLSEFIEVTKANNKATTLLTVNGPIDPNLTVSYKDMMMTPSPAQERGNANISALVKNEGFSSASNILVNFYEGVPGVDGILLGSQTIPLLNAGDSARASIDWVGIQDVGKKIIYVKVDPDNVIHETSKDDNTAFLTLQILTLPDLAISTNSIVFTPVAPKDGDPVSINVTIKNLGEQSASNVVVKAYEGSMLIGTQTISGIAGNSQAATSFSFDTTGKSGPHQITIIVDPDNTIVERIKENNTASRTFGVQNAKLWVTEQFISPNGDGIKDSTQVFFGLDAPQTVQILIVNERGETVRTFRGADLENATGGNVVWNGLYDNGSVAADGQYHIRVTDMNGNILGSLLVTLDNNRSPLSRALGTKYLLNSNLTCKLPDFSDWKWLPSESGMIFSINYTDADADASGYPPGLYSMAPDGDDVIRLVPDNSVPYEWAIEAFDISPDGERVAFIANDRLWVVNSDGKQLTMLDEPSSGIYDVRWSPDKKHLLYNVGLISKQQGGITAYELWIVNAETRAKTKIDWGFLTLGLGAAEWSPDGQHIAYLALSDSMLQQYGAQVDELKLSDLSGNKSVIYTFDRTTWYTQMYWLDKWKIAFQHLSQSNQLWAYDLTGGGNHLFISEYPDQVVQNPDKGGITYRERLNDRKIYVRTVNAEGSISTHYEASDLQVNSGSGSTSNLSNLIWSFDGRKLAFADMSYKKIDKCIYEPALIVIDAPSMKRNDMKIFNAEVAYAQEGYSYNSDCADPSKYALNNVESIASWLPDNENLLLLDNKGYFDFNTTTGEKGGYIPIDGVEAVSPAGRYINYYRDADPAGICHGRGWPDVWAIGSMLNLTADLRINKERSLIRMKGIAADLNFEGYRLEYADAKTPDNWNLVGPPSDMSVLNDLLTTWVPPHEGAFFLKLTVWDKAGNIAIDRKRVSWGLSAGITNLYKTREIFSPNGDGLKDTVELHYTVLEPVHLDFFIYAEDNSIVRTLNRDHTSPLDDFITWDGRDESGRIVPDGKYKIKLFDYEFFVEVDNTPPDANITLGPVTGIFESAEDRYYVFKKPYRQAITALAYDKNMKSWTIEYGKGENPLEWLKYAEDTGILVGYDVQGNIILKEQEVGAEYLNVRKSLNDIFDIDSYQTSNYIGWRANDKFKITAEDYAGNKSSLITQFEEEKILLYEWDNEYAQKDVIPGALARPGKHYLGGLHTIRNQIASAVLQYSRNYSPKRDTWSDWNDAISIPDWSGAFFEWDISNLNLGSAYGVRQRYVDINGREYYSNILHPERVFDVQVLCKREFPTKIAMRVVNSSFEKQRSLKFQIRSSGDARYNTWTDIDVLNSESVFNLQTHSFEGDEIPEGDLIVHINESIFMPGVSYELRMVGIIDDQHMNISAPSNYPPECPIWVELDIDYTEADCGQVSGRAALRAQVFGFSRYITPVSLNIYFDKSEGLQLIPPSAQELDTTKMAEGSYPVKAIFKYKDAGSDIVQEVYDTKQLIVDRVLPTTHMSYPGKSTSVCPVKNTDQAGDWLGIPVEAVAMDNKGVNAYSLFYSVGEDTAFWPPATTRIKGRKEVEVREIAGEQSVQGQIGIWNVTGLTDSTYSLLLKVTDSTGNTSCESISFSVDTTIEIASVIADEHIVSPNGDGTMDDVTASYQIDEYATVAAKVFKASRDADGSYVLDSTPVRTIASGIQHLGGSGSVAWDGMADSGSAVPDGLYGIAVMPTDSCGNTNMKWVPVEVDNTLPTMVITYPSPVDPIGNVVEIRGTADDLHFLSYSLEAGEGDIPNAWLPISSGASTVKDGILGIWNTFGLQGRWTLKLTGSDTVGNKNETSVTIDLGTRKDIIKELNVLPRLFSPNNDGKIDTTNINYNLTNSSAVNIEIIDSSGTVRKTYTTIALSAGAYMYMWDGRDSAGILVPDGTYVIKLTAALSSNPSVNQIETVTVVVDTAVPLIDIKQPIINS